MVQQVSQSAFDAATAALQAGHDGLTAERQNVNALVSQLHGTWRSSTAASAYANAMTQWFQNASKIEQALESMNKSLGSTAELSSQAEDEGLRNAGTLAMNL